MTENESEYFSPYRTDGKLFGFVCIVTGADGPIGQAVVAELATHGAAVVFACTTTLSSLPPSIEDLTKTYPNTKIIHYPFTITSENDTLGLIDEVLNSWGRLDVWASCSGLIGPSSITDTTPTDLQRCFEANALAPFFALKYAPAAMKKTTPKGNYANAAPKDQRYGSIIVVTSTASTYGGCWGPCFTMTSHAALGVVRSGVAVLKGSGVRINAISPGSIDVGVDLNQNSSSSNATPASHAHSQQLPPVHLLQSEETHHQNIGLERTGTPKEVARVAGFLASGFSSYITGANLVVDGGASVMNPIMAPV